MISDDSVSCYSRMDINREATMKTVKALLPLHNPSIIAVLHSTLKSDMEAPISTNKINQAFAIEQFREDGNIMTYFVYNRLCWQLEKMDRCAGEHSTRKIIKKTGKNLKEVSVIPMDIDTPMLLRSKSSMSNKSLTSSSSDDTHQETTE